MASLVHLSPSPDLLFFHPLPAFKQALRQHSPGNDEPARCLQHVGATLMLALCREGGEGGGQEVESLVADLRHDLADMRRQRDRYRHLCRSLAVSLFAEEPHSLAHPLLCHVFVRGGFVLVGMSVSAFAAVDETGRVPGRHKERTKLIDCVQSSGSS